MVDETRAVRTVYREGLEWMETDDQANGGVPMRFRIVPALGLVALLAACSSPTGPRYPEPPEDPNDPRPPNTPDMIGMDADGVITFGSHHG
jgi:hypothetical protein